MKLTLRYFASWREELGRAEETREFPDGTPVNQVADLVAAGHPRLEGLSRSTLLMVNQEYAAPHTPLRDGDEVAFIPPVSGGTDRAAKRYFRVVETELELHEVIDAVADPGAGAIASFTGTVRDNAQGKTVTALTYEAYPAAAEKMLARIGDEISARWPVIGVACIHRVGRLAVGEASIVLAVSSPHRHAAFEACEYAIVRLKEIVPIWKKEAYTDGAVWIGSETEYPRDAASSVEPDRPGPVASEPSAGSAGGGGAGTRGTC